MFESSSLNAAAREQQRAENRQAFIEGYIDACLWANLYQDEDDDGSTSPDLPVELSRPLLTFDSVKDLVRDAVSFFTQEFTALSEAAENRAWDLLGHDFALTRNGHGTGFWDRGLGDLGDHLTDSAKVYGTVDLWLLNDNTIEVI